MAGTCYLPVNLLYLPYIRAENKHLLCSLHLLYLLMYYYEKKVLTRAHDRYRPRKGEKACRRVQ